MFANLDTDMVVFSEGVDDALYTNSTNYKSTNNESFNKLKSTFFAVLIHGLADSFVVGNVRQNGKVVQLNWNVNDMFTQILCAWCEKGGNRGILLLSCYAGISLAQPLAIRLQLPIVAPRSAATVTSNGEIECLKMSEKSPNTLDNKVVKSNVDWGLFSPTGQMEIQNGQTLNKTNAINFVKRYRTLHI